MGQAGNAAGDGRGCRRCRSFPPTGGTSESPISSSRCRSRSLPAGGPDIFATSSSRPAWPRTSGSAPSSSARARERRFITRCLRTCRSGAMKELEGKDGTAGFVGLNGLLGIDPAELRPSGGLGGWAVGGTPRDVSGRTGVTRLAKGTDLVLQMHFHPTGKPETEQSVVGSYFADRAPARRCSRRRRYRRSSAFERHRHQARRQGLHHPGLDDVARGRARLFRDGARALPGQGDEGDRDALPDGSVQPLLWIQDWDFNWQDTLRLQAAALAAKGHAHRCHPPLRQLRRESSQSEQSAQADSVGRAVLRRNGNRRIHLRGPPEDRRGGVPVVAGERNKAAIAAAGQNGTLGRFLARQQRQNRGLQQLTVFDRQGTVVSRVGEPGAYAQATFSPDGSRLAVIEIDPDSDTQDVWAFDVATGKGTSITSDSAPDAAPIWSPDGGRDRLRVSPRQHPRRVRAFVLRQGRRRNALSTHDRRIHRADGLVGRWPLPLFLVGRHDVHPAADRRQWTAQGDRARTRRVLRPRRASLPDGRFLAFNSNRSGRLQSMSVPSTCCRRPEPRRLSRKSRATAASAASCGARTEGSCSICRSHPARR